MNTPPFEDRNVAPFPREHAGNGSRNPLSADLSAWDWCNPLKVLPLGIVLAVAVSLVQLFR